MGKRSREEADGGEVKQKVKKLRHDAEDEPLKKDKKDKKDKQKKKKSKSKSKPLEPASGDLPEDIPDVSSETVVQADDGAEPVADAPAAASATQDASAKQDASEKPAKKARFIVFVGNLPFSATTESIEKHFAKIHPDSIRHITEKASDAAVPQKGSKKNNRKTPNTPKSKGFAFLEFTSFDRMKTCLKLYHHSNFADGKKPVRKINCELTAGGGGKGKARSEKVMIKNAKLDEQRKQQNVAKKTQKAEKAENAQTGAAPLNDIHPSRRGQVPGGRR